MPTLVEYKTLEENIELCKKLNLDFIELNLDVPCCSIDRIDESLLAKCNYTIHMSEKFDVGELNNSLRNFYIDEAERIIAFGTKHNIFKYNMHLDPGIHFTLPDKKIFIYEQYLDDYINAYKESCQELSKIARKYNATILFENVKMESFTKEAINIVSKYDNLYFTLDLGHNIRYGNTAKQEFMKYSHKIKHIHLHDFDGSKDHQQLFTGILDIPEELKFCKQNDLDVLIEVKRSEELINSVSMLRGLNYIN